MVRPIEITDALAKSQEVGRMQQNAQMRPEAAQEFQKTINDRMHQQQLHSPNPVPESDQVVIHVDEQNRRKKYMKDRALPPKKAGQVLTEPDDKPKEHIDIKI